jgi:endonuclease/exonuclease/phosphatase family metal-dependent hydrolase
LKTNTFPGEVRACELAALKRLVESTTQADEIVVLAGDFNTDAKEALGVFAGNFKSSDPEDGCEFQTGFDAESKTFRWGSRVLQDAFAETHQWGKSVGAGKHCTSRNANRIEWIDYIFHDGMQLETLELTKCVTPPVLIPDEQNPSDHLPLTAQFRLL